MKQRQLFLLQLIYTFFILQIFSVLKSLVKDTSVIFLFTIFIILTLKVLKFIGPNNS